MKYKLYSKILLMIGILLFVTISNNSVNGQQSFDDGPFLYMYHSDLSGVSVDGVISTNEYPTTDTLYDRSGDVVSKLSWTHNNTHIAVALQADVTGWIGLGLGEVGVTMAGADMVVGFVEGNALTIKDMYALKHGKPNIDDEHEGVDNVLESAGIEGSGTTTIEFIIPMQSNDTQGKDHSWIVGETYGFFSAISNFDSFSNSHSTHTESLKVKVLDNTFADPVEVDVTMTTTSFANNTLLIKVTVVDNSDTITLDGLQIGIYKKSLFGKALMDIVVLDATGNGQILLLIEASGEVDIRAILPATTGSQRAEVGEVITFDASEVVISNEYQEGDLRLNFGDHMMRDFILTLFLIIVLTLIFTYLGVAFDLLSIFKEGRKEVTK